MDWKQVLPPLCRSRIETRFAPAGEDLPAGSSKFGGRPDVPAGFVKGEPICFSDDERERFQYALYYMRGDDYIQFTAIKGPGKSAVYEKNDDQIAVLDIGGSDFYVFQNSGQSVAVWVTDNLDCSITTNLEIDPLTEILTNSYS